MQTIIELFLGDFKATIIVFLALLIVIAYLFARKKSVAVLSGLMLIIVSLFYSPFIYFKKAVLGLADYDVKGKSDSVQPKQYLLNKLLFSLQALLVLISIAILAAGFVSGWNQMVPSKQLRETIRASEEELKQLKSELQETEPAVKQMETVWSTRRDSLINAYTKERAHNAETMIAQNQDLASRINASSDTAQQAFSEIRNYHGQNEFLGQPSQYEPLIVEITGYIERQPLSPEVKNLLLKYNDNWYTQMLSRFETAALSESQLRFAAHPSYHNGQQRLDFLKETIPSQEKELAQFRTELKYDFGAFVLQMLFTVIQFILFVWLIGILIESLWLWVDAAANLQKIQEHFTRQ